MEAKLRENMNGALGDMWHSWMDDTESGVMAGVYYLSEQIERSVANPLIRPVQFEPPLREIPLSDERHLQEEKDDDETVTDDRYADE